jgi:hypothetical protein
MNIVAPATGVGMHRAPASDNLEMSPHAYRISSEDLDFVNQKASFSCDL